MSIETTYKEFRFKSSWIATVVNKSFGLGLIWISFDSFLRGWLQPSLERLPYMILLLPFGLFLLAVGAMFVLNSCQIEILDGQLRFRRFVTWQSVPLDSITSMRLLWAPGSYLKVIHAGKCHRLIFSPEDYKMYWRRSPVIQILQETCKRNAERSSSQAPPAILEQSNWRLFFRKRPLLIGTVYLALFAWFDWAATSSGHVATGWSSLVVDVGVEIFLCAWAAVMTERAIRFVGCRLHQMRHSTAPKNK